MKRIHTVLTIICVVFAAAGCGMHRHPGDADLVELLRRSRPDFERIIVMLQEDQAMVRIAPGFMKATGKVDATYQHWIEDPKISEDRWAEYRKIFKRIGARDGIAASKDRRVISYLISTEGLSIGGTAKGIVFSRTKPDRLVESLDSPGRPGKAGVSYVHIEGDWYIFFDWTN